MTVKHVKSFGYSLPTSYYSSWALHVYFMYCFNGHQKLAWLIVVPTTHQLQLILDQEKNVGD
jgi:hypothetical protein